MRWHLGRRRTNVEDRRTPGSGEPEARRVRLGGPGRYRGHLEGALPARRCGLRGAAPGAVLGCHRIGLRLRRGGGRAVLLPGRPEGLSGPRLLRRARPPVRCPGRLRPGLCRGTRGGPRRADAARHLAPGARGAGRAGRARPQPAAGDDGAAGRLPRRGGRTMRSGRATSSSRATSRRAWRRPRRWVTTASSGGRRAGWCPTLSPTARPSSANAGS